MIAPWTETAQRYWDRRGRLNLWSGVLAHQALAHNVEEARKNSEAESAHVRRTQWGETGGDTTEGADVMGTTILGDVQTQPPVIVTGGGTAGSFLKTAAALLLGASVPTAFAAGWLLNKPETVVEPGDDIRLGLGKLEDYLRAPTDGGTP